MNLRKLMTRSLSKAMTLGLSAAAALAPGAEGLAHAQAAPRALVTTSTTLPTPTGFGGPNGNLATDKFGDLFVPDAANSQVLEFPANGGPAIVIFSAGATSPQVSGVAVDAANNLYVTTRYDGSLSATDSDIFKFPYSSGGYPAPYTYTGAAPAICTAASTGVCTYGNFLQTTGFYYQPQAIGFDAAGNGYMITTYDSLSGGGKTIYACDVQCGYDQDSATIAVTTLPTKATSLAVAPNGDLYWADGTDVYYSAAGSGKVVLFDTSLEYQYGSAQGVNFDRAGNFYAANGQGTFEYPLVGGVIKASNKFLVSSAYVYTGSAISPNGDVFSSNYSAVTKTDVFNYNFGAAAIGTTVGAQTFTITFLTAGTIGTLTAQQSGTASTEFALAPGTCTAAAAFAAGGTCSFTVSFTPTAVGVRRAVITLTDTGNNQVATYVTGTGQGTGVAVDPGTPTTITSTLTAPSGLAVDASGNVFVADATAKAVYEYRGGTGTPVTIGNGYAKPTGVALDGGGNLYVVDQGAGTLQVIANGGGTFAATNTVLVSGLKAPTDVVIGGSGAIYVSNTGANTVLQYPNASRLGSLSVANSLGVALNAPTGLALDPSGNLYIADTGNNRAVQLTYSGAQTVVGSGLNLPTGIAAEPSGSVVIADQGNGRVVRVPNEVGVLTSADQVTLTQPLLNPYFVRLASNGSLYVSDNQVGAVEVLQRTAGTLNFGISNVNTPTAAQTVVVSSTGTADLTLNSPFFTAPPPASNFTLTTGAGSVGCTSGTLTSGRDCTLSAVFTPTSTGTKSYTAPLNTVATNSATPSIMLVGQGVQLVPVTVTLSRTPAGTVTFGQPVTLTATVASASASSSATPTGTVTFNINGSLTKPIALMNGVATYALPQQNGNTALSIIATYNGGAVYASGSSTPATFTIIPASTAGVLTISADDQAPLSSTPTDMVYFSVTITPSVLVSGALNGTVNFVSGNTLLGSATISQNSATLVYSAGISLTLPASCAPGQTLPNCSGIYQVQAVYAGNGNYSGFTTAAQALVITNPTYTVTSSTNTITSTAAQYGSATLAVTSYSAYQAGVALSCSGLPVNAYCIFRPGLISLTYVVTTPATATTTAISTIPVQTTTMEIRVSQDPTTIKSVSGFGLLGLLAATVVFFTGLRYRRGLRGLGLCCLLGVTASMTVGSLSGCGSGTSSATYPTPAGTYPITLIATATPLATGGGSPTTYNLTGSSSQGTTVTVTTAPPYATNYAATSGNTPGQAIFVTGNSNPAYNGTFIVTSSVSMPGAVVNNVQQYYSILTYTSPSATTGTGSGGAVRVANNTLTQNFTLIVK